MRFLHSFSIMAFAVPIILTPSSALLAHHNTQAEYGPFDSPTVYVEGRIVRVIWGNPHIAIEMETTGGEVAAGEKWRLESHPIRIMQEYGFDRTDFAAGDSVKLLAWKHIRNAPMMWPRAIQINDGPMRSNLRFTDMIDIANGVFDDMNIVAAGNLNGSNPGRAGTASARKLGEMGLLDDDGLMIWPPPR
jgi:hypothetical protein